MSSMKKQDFFDMLKNGNVIGFEKEVCSDIEKYLDKKLGDNITFEENNYRIGEGFKNLIEFTKFKNVFVTSELKEIKGEDGKVQAKKYYEYKTLEFEDSIAILVGTVIVISKPEVETFYEVEAKLYVFTNN